MPSIGCTSGRVVATDEFGRSRSPTRLEPVLTKPLGNRPLGASHMRVPHIHRILLHGLKERLYAGPDRVDSPALGENLHLLDIPAVNLGQRSLNGEAPLPGCAAWTRPAPNRNGGRHCCQPPLRRAKDLPVFMVLIPKDRFLEIQAHQLRRRFPSDNSLRRGDRPFTGLRHPRGFACLPTSCLAEPKPLRCSAALLGSITLCVPLCPSTRRLPNRVALEEDQLFRRLFPTGSANLRRVPHCLSAEIGPSVTLRFLLALASFPVEAGTSVPITLEQCTSPPSRGSEKCVLKPVDNGDIGNNRRNLPDSPQSVPLTDPGSARTAASSASFSIHPIRSAVWICACGTKASGSSSVAICTSIWPGKDRLAGVEQPVPQLGQKCRRPCSDEAYSRVSPSTFKSSLATSPQATIGAPECRRQSLQWQSAWCTVFVDISYLTAPQWH